MGLPGGPHMYIGTHTLSSMFLLCKVYRGS